MAIRWSRGKTLHFTLARIACYSLHDSYARLKNTVIILSDVLSCPAPNAAASLPNLTLRLRFYGRYSWTRSLVGTKPKDVSSPLFRCALNCGAADFCNYRISKDWIDWTMMPDSASAAGQVGLSTRLLVLSRRKTCPSWIACGWRKKKLKVLY